MRVINSIPWSPTEIESYRQIIWDNLIEGMVKIREVMDELSIQTSEENMVRRPRARLLPMRSQHSALAQLHPASTDGPLFLRPQALFHQVARPFELGGQQAYPPRYQSILQTLWEDSAVQKVRAVGSTFSRQKPLNSLASIPPRPFQRARNSLSQTSTSLYYGTDRT